MNVFLPNLVCAQQADVIRRWAAMEGKSRTMSEDLLREYAERNVTRRVSPNAMIRVAELATLASEAVRLYRSRF